MTENKILKWALILSIGIVANLFFNYALSLILNAPDIDEYCPFEKTSQVIETKQACEQADGIWNPTPGVEKSAPVTGYCDLYSKCNNLYQTDYEVYVQKVFVDLIIIGVIVLIASFFVSSNPVLASAFAFTAVLDFIIASVRYWEYSNDIVKVALLFVALVTLIYLAIKKFKN